MRFIGNLLVVRCGWSEDSRSSHLMPLGGSPNVLNSLGDFSFRLCGVLRCGVSPGGGRPCQKVKCAGVGAKRGSACLKGLNFTKVEVATCFASGENVPEPEDRRVWPADTVVVSLAW